MAKPNPLPRLLAVADISDLLRVSTKTVHRWIERGDLRVHRLGRSVRVSQDDLDAFLAKHRH